MLVSLSIFKLLLDQGLQLLGFHARLGKLNHLAIPIEHEFGEVPRNYRCLIGGFIIELAIVSQIAVKGMSGRPIDLNFLEERKVHLEIFLYELFDVPFATFFLAEELVAWESEYLKTALMVSFVEANQLLVIDAGESSLASHVYHDEAFGLVLIVLEIDKLSIDILDLEAEEAVALLLR